MDKWSVVIPTLWKSDFLHEQLKEYIDSDRIGEVIVIDNSGEYYNYYNELLDKLVLIQPSENIFVNPSWNIGVHYAKYENVAIANDDILWNTELLSHITDSILEEYGIIGQEKANFTNSSLQELKNETPEPIFSNLNYKRPNAWGCLLFVKKDYWKDIPHQIKIWYGDDWLINKSGLKTSKITNIKIGGELHATEMKEFHSQRIKDGIIYGTL